MPFVTGVNMDTEGKKINYIKEILQWLQAILLAVVIALLIRAFLFEPVIVHGRSMENTLSTGQRLIVNKLGYNLHKPERGDIIVLKYQDGLGEYIPFLKNMPLLKRIFPPINEIDYIKRIVALPGEEIDIKDGHVYINDKKLDEPYTVGETYEKSMELPAVVPSDSVFVMGDNRQNSRDSRQMEVGFISFDRIKGRAFFRIWPIEEVGRVK